MFIQVNTDGVLTFTNKSLPFSNDKFPINTDYEIIAPFWADVDTTGTGDITYRKTTDANLLQRANDHVKRAFPTVTFLPKYLFIATWDHVGFFEAQTMKVCTFDFSIT